MNSLDLYMNYLHAIEYKDSPEIIKMYERLIMEKYKIKIKTKQGTYEYEKEDLQDLDLLLEKHKDYEELKAEKEKTLCKKKVLRKP